MKHSSKHFFKTLFLLVLPFSFFACIGGGTIEPSRYYTISTEPISVSKKTNTKESVFVKKFTIASAYKRNNIVYRESAYSFMFYDLDLWASRPEDMITKTVKEYLKQSEVFTVFSKNATTKPTFEIFGNIDAIEEIDEGSSRYARLSLQLTLQKTTGEIITEKDFDEKLALNGNTPEHVAEGISKLLAKYMETFLQEF